MIQRGAQTLNLSALEKILFSGIDSVRPEALFSRILKAPPYEELRKWVSGKARYLLCIGKAGLSSAEAILPHVSCQNYFVISPPTELKNLNNVCFGSHPIPDFRSKEAAEKLLIWLGKIPSNSDLLVVLSGGASALMVAPAEGISLESKMKVNDLLIRSGATIQEMNAVRKHISAIKGGKLARAVRNLNCVVLVISDVIGNDLSTIGSGPFYPDNSTFAQACEVLQKYQIWDDAPAEVKSVLMRGVRNQVPETPKPGSENEIPHYIIASNDIAREAATVKARELGYEAQFYKEPVSGQVEEVASRILALISASIPGSAVILGGETTLRVQGSGVGGRNQHLSLLLTEAIAGTQVLFAAAGTDGIDGNSPAAGAWTDGETLERSVNAGLSLRRSLESFDSYHFFRALKQDITTGSTGTNVMDLYIALKN